MVIAPGSASRLRISSSLAQSGMKLWPAPVARTFVAVRTRLASSSSLCGRVATTGPATLPDQLLQPIFLSPQLAAKLSGRGMMVK